MKKKMQIVVQTKIGSGTFQNEYELKDSLYCLVDDILGSLSGKYGLFVLDGAIEKLKKINDNGI